MVSKGAREADANDYTDEQLSPVSDFVAQLQLRTWFDGKFDKQAEPYMVRLLVGMYQAYRDGHLLTKKEAMAIMRAVDSRTSQRYVRLARDSGLLKIEQSTTDQRVDFLCPTAPFFDLMKDENTKFATEVRYLTEAIVGRDMSTATPKLDWTQNPYRRMRHRTINTIVPRRPNDTVSEIEKERPRRITRLSETIRLMPQNLEAYRQRAREYADAGEKHLAHADLVRITELNPHDEVGWLELAYFNFNRHEYDAALKEFTVLLSFNPTDPNIYADRGNIYLRQRQDYQAAILDLTKAIELLDEAEARGEHDSMLESTMLLLDRAAAYEKLGHFQEAIADVRRILADDERDVLANLRLIELEQRLSEQVKK